jgi:hypothetical protein
MGIQILERSTKYYNQFNNGVGFTDNLSKFTDNFTGSVMNKIKLVKEIQVEWFSKTKDSGATWTVNTSTGTLQSSTNKFIIDGFAVGDDFLYEDVSAGAGANFTGRITSISPNTIIFNLTSGSRTNVDTDAVMRGYSDLTAVNYRFGLIGNSESFNAESKVSGNDQGYYGSGIGFDTGGGVRDTNFVDLQKLGSYQDWITGSVRARFVSSNYNFATTSIGSQTFQIEHEFIIVPYYLEGEITNLQNNVLPNLFTGLNTLKYVYSPGFRTVLSNPNTEKKIVVDRELGSVAWFGENFNGFNANYEVLNVFYEEAATTNNADGVLITSKTQVTIDVKNLVGDWISGGERAGVYISYLPEQIEYTNTILTDLKENFLYDAALNNEGLSPVNGSNNIISNFRIIPLDDDELRLIFDVEYSLAQKLRLSALNSQSPAQYLIGVELGDATIADQGNSDKLILLADVNKYDESADIPNLLNFTKFDILTHEKQLGVLGGTTDVTAWNEDGILVDYTFNLDLNKQAVLNSLDFLLVAYDPSTKKYFELDKYSYNIFPSIVSGGIQQLILNATRGYILKLGDQFNDVTLGVGTNTANVQDYNGLIGQKFSWQDWIENLGVDTIFFDPTKPNNNFNLKSSNYSFLNGYEIRLAFLGNLFGTSDLGVSGLTDYLTLTPPLIVYDYKKDGNATPIWSETIETFDVTGTNNLNGAILTGQDTLLRSTWVNSLGAVTTLVGLWGINRIEETNQIGFSITEISTINLPGSNQLLKPKNGLTLCDIQIVGGNVVLECLIDGNVAQSGVNYNLSTRIQDNNFVILGKQTETGAFKDTETSVIKVVE